MANMRTTRLLLKHVPSIKFVGGPHPAPSTIDTAVHAHVASGGLIPNGDGALQISQLNWPKLVIADPPKKAAPTQSVAKPSGAIIPSDRPYDFTSVAQLPKKFQNPAIDEGEIDVVNGGGAGLLI